MRLLSTLLLGLLLTSGLFAQSSKDQISSTLTTYFKLVEEQNVSEFLDYVHPQLIGMMGREMFEQQYEAFFNAPNLNMTMENIKADKISDVFEHETGKFAMVSYSFKMTLVMKPDQDETAGNLIFETYKKQFGEENVTMEKQGTYIVNGSRELFACQQEGFDGWKLLDYEPGMKMILTQFIDKAVFTHFNK